jgi:predicted metalloprotease with PDZ domain
MDNGFFSKVTLVHPFSPAWKAGLFAGDEIMAVNNMMLKNNLNNWLSYFLDNEEIQLHINSGDQMKTIALQKDKKGTTWFFNPVLKLKDQNPSEAFEIWKRF